MNRVILMLFLLFIPILFKFLLLVFSRIIETYKIFQVYIVQCYFGDKNLIIYNLQE